MRNVKTVSLPKECGGFCIRNLEKEKRRKKKKQGSLC